MLLIISNIKIHRKWQHFKMKHFFWIFSAKSCDSQKRSDADGPNRFDRSKCSRSHQRPLGRSWPADLLSAGKRISFSRLRQIVQKNTYKTQISTRVHVRRRRAWHFDILVINLKNNFSIFQRIIRFFQFSGSTWSPFCCGLRSDHWRRFTLSSPNHRSG